MIWWERRFIHRDREPVAYWTLMIIGVGVFVYFVLFFLLGYLTFVCVYAIAGAACNTDKEAPPSSKGLAISFTEP